MLQDEIRICNVTRFAVSLNFLLDECYYILTNLYYILLHIFMCLLIGFIICKLTK